MLLRKLFGRKDKKKEDKALADGLERTRTRFFSKIRNLLGIGRKFDSDTRDELEGILMTADVGVATTTKILDHLEEAYRNDAFGKADGALDYLRSYLIDLIGQDEPEIRQSEKPPTVILVAGVNGTGKTTSIAKLAYLFKNEGKKVLLCASDTFRAAAVEQLTLWSERIGVDIVKQHSGADPAAVTFDALDAAIARKMDVCIVDTAGRLHTHQNLMRELSKIHRVIQRKIPDAPHEVLLVLDATTGQNAISQAKLFKEAVEVTGLFLAKLDGTAKGGIILAIRDQLALPVKFVGLGEQAEDIAVFDSRSFISALL
ncbi:MAG: signal recognition particle-docking protein FtsY [Planctomycetota bacterium]|nr:signal recognition particle-docking protein FtsY [Planctomycetota bacterium]